MSIQDLKSRMSDVAGIETLTMGLEAGRIALRWADHSAVVDSSASDAECEADVDKRARVGWAEIPCQLDRACAC
jgi:hypothetical protein